ncbi:MAG: hypothetical protein ACQEP8_06400 [Chlamydiota bacterium]
MKILRICSAFLASFLASVLSFFIYYYGYSSEGWLEEYILYSTLGAVGLILTIITITFLPILRSEYHTTPGVLNLLKEDFKFQSVLAYFTVFPLISLVMLLSSSENDIHQYLIPAWTILLGVTLDFCRWTYRHVYKILNPEDFFSLLTSKAYRAASQGSVDDFLAYHHKIAALSCQALNPDHIADHNTILKKLHLLYCQILTLSLDHHHQAIQKNLGKLLTVFSQSYESMINSTIQKNLPVPCENSLHALRSLINITTLYYPSLGSIPLACLHKSLDLVYKNTFDPMLVGITCEILSENSVELLSHLNIDERDTANFYQEIFSFLEYFTSTSPTIPEEALTKQIIIKAIAPLARQFCQEPLNSKPTSFTILKKTLPALEQHRRAKYSQKDFQYYQELLRLAQDIEIALPEVE